jgi:cysteine desulfurase
MYSIAKPQMHDENKRIRALHERMLAGLKDAEEVFSMGMLEKRACRTT